MMGRQSSTEARSDAKGSSMTLDHGKCTRGNPVPSLDVTSCSGAITSQWKLFQ